MCTFFFLLWNLFSVLSNCYKIEYYIKQPQYSASKICSLNTACPPNAIGIRTSMLAFEQSVHFRVWSSLAVHCVQLMLICRLCVYLLSEKM